MLPSLRVVPSTAIKSVHFHSGRATLTLYDMMPRAFSSAVESGVPDVLSSGAVVFAVYHCGARGQLNRSLAAQREDWKRIGNFLLRDEEVNQTTKALSQGRQMVENRLKKLLGERGKTLYWLAKETGISYDRLAIHYKDSATMIRYLTLERICEVLQCQIGDLLVLNGLAKRKENQ